MNSFTLHAANLLSENCVESAEIYSKLFDLKIIVAKTNHAELKSTSSLHIFLDKPSIHCPISPGSISFSVSFLNIKEVNLEPLLLESYYEKENYASFVDEYKNRIWIFERK